MPAPIPSGSVVELGWSASERTSDSRIFDTTWLLDHEAPVAR
jgi:hypothetical protein